MKNQSNTWVFTIYTSAVKEKHQKRWYDNSIPDSDDPGSPIFCDNFRQDNSTLLTTWKTSSFTGTVSIIDTKARRHNSSEELQTYNHHFQILSKKSDKYKDNWKKKESVSHLQSTRTSKSIWRNLSILNSFDNPKRITAKSLQIGAGKNFRKHKWKINKNIKHLISSSMFMVVRNTLYPSKYPKPSLETYQNFASDKFYAN